MGLRERIAVGVRRRKDLLELTRRVVALPRREPRRIARWRTS